MNKSKQLLLGLVGLSVLGAVTVLGMLTLPGILISPQQISSTEVSGLGASTENTSRAADTDSLHSVQQPPEVITPPGKEPAPDFRGIEQWINSPPLSLAELQGKVVLVDFWTYSCINCQRTLPHVASWHAKYLDHGLVVVGVHSPEFEFESVEANVREAVQRQNVSWAVAMDNDFRTWRAYQNRWWPHKFLIDQDGIIRYDHIGEGAYQETELHIRNLLTEAGRDISEVPVGGVESIG